MNNRILLIFAMFAFANFVQAAEADQKYSVAQQEERKQADEVQANNFNWKNLHLKNFAIAGATGFAGMHSYNFYKNDPQAFKYFTKISAAAGLSCYLLNKLYNNCDVIHSKCKAAQSFVSKFMPAKNESADKKDASLLAQAGKKPAQSQQSSKPPVDDSKKDESKKQNKKDEKSLVSWDVKAAIVICTLAAGYCAYDSVFNN